MPQFIADDYECVVSRSADGKGFLVEYPDLPGAAAYGGTRSEAVSAAEEVLSAWLRHAEELRIDIPAPGDARGATGEFKLHVPRGVHARLQRLSAEYDLTLSEVTSRLIVAGVSRSFARAAGSKAGAFSCAHLPAQRVVDIAKANVEDREYSGTWVQRVSRVLHVHLARLADEEGVSINGLSNHFISYELGKLDALASVHLEAQQSTKTAA